MSTENNTGIQTRAMAQQVDNEANLEQLQRAADPAMNPTVELHRTKEEAIKEFVWQHGTIALDWYVPDLCNIRVGNLIKKRLQLETREGRILFRSPALSEFFKTSNFELNLRTGGVSTYLDPPEDIGIKCQKETFDLEFLRDTLWGEEDTSTIQEERLERIASVKKLVGPADIMPREEAEYKVRQYCHLWMMYADSSVELKKKSELSQESAVAACKMYVPYISDIVRQIEEVVKIFAIEKELRLIKNRGYFPVPQLAPEECKIETIQDKEVLLTEIDQQQLRYEQRNQNYLNRYDNNQDRNRYDNNQDRNRFDNRRRPNKYQHHRNQHKAQVIFEFSDQNVMKMMQTVQQFFNEDSDVIFDALVAADYIDEIDCTDGTHQQQAWLPEKYNANDYFSEVAKNVDIYNIDELGPTTGTVFQIFANNNLNIKINTLFDTGAMKSVMSLEMYEKLKLKDLDTTSIPHVVEASGESLGVRGRTKCKVNINRRIFYQTFIVCKHLKRPIILGRDFSIQNCIGISWTKTNTHQLTQNNKVIAETAEYQTPSRASVSLKKNIKVPPRSCAVVDVDINTTEKIKVEVIPDQLWLSANPNICTYPMIADLKERDPNTVTPFVIVNFSHHKHLHLPKDHVVAFPEKAYNEE